jgi:signal transduction histidine kinase
MLGLRAKLSLGFGGLLVIILIIGGQSILLLKELGESIDVILRENYRSVIAAQDMKEAIERINTATLSAILGNRTETGEALEAHERKFEHALRTELSNITLPGEGEKAQELKELYRQCQEELKAVNDTSKPYEVRREQYFQRMLPLVDRIKELAEDILSMNQQNMSEANERARESATAATLRMYGLLLAGTLLAVAFVVFVGKWIIRPITRLRETAEEIARGNLDVVIQEKSGDEIGKLSSSFSTMAESLRAFRRSGQARLMRIQRATQEAFSNLPEPIAVLDPYGEVEVSTDAASSIFGLKRGVNALSAMQESLGGLVRECTISGQIVESTDEQALIQKFVGGEERYFHPKAVPMADAGGNVTGTVLILADVTRQREQDELKRGVIATVSHQLKTPLTSVRMAMYLLLEEKIGPLTERQVDLLMTARDDTERLCTILDNLLDISRYESSSALIECCPAVRSEALVLDAVDAFRRTAQDKGLSLNVDLPGDLPDVLADAMEIGHVFANLLTNALRFTPPGGTIAVSAGADDLFVRFCVSDTGVGIPEVFRERIFDPFFRVPGQQRGTGAGLGLSIARRIVEAHGGSMAVENSESQGSNFCFSLKRADTSCEEGTDHD